MKSAFICAFAAALAAFFAGCASTYTGPLPDLNPTNREQAQQTREKFAFERQSFFSSGDYFKMNGETYSRSSLEPLIEAVSPEAYRLLQEGKTIKIVSDVAFAATFVGAIAWLAASKSQRTGFLIGTIASAVACNATRYWYMGRIGSVTDQYNMDLEKKVSVKAAFAF